MVGPVPSHRAAAEIYRFRYLSTAQGNSVLVTVRPLPVESTTIRGIIFPPGGTPPLELGFLKPTKKLSLRKLFFTH